MSSFIEAKNIPHNRDDPFPLKSWLNLTYPLLIAASLDMFCLVRASEQSSIMGFPTSHQPRFYAAPNVLKMGIKYDSKIFIEI